jgi:hypothetical protein
MLHDPARLEAALAALVGLPLWSSNRSVDLQVFHFGAKRTVTRRTGGTAEVGELALHVQCAWRIRGPRGIVVASGDRCLRPGDDPLANPDDDWDWCAPGANRCDARLRDWLDERSYDVERANADPTGGIVLAFAGGFALDVFPDDSLDGEYSERWRLFRPDDLDSHFVVSGGGLEPPVR